MRVSKKHDVRLNEIMEFLLASNQFYLDVSVFYWTVEELETRAATFVRIMELALGAQVWSFGFLLDVQGDNLSNGGE